MAQYSCGFWDTHGSSDFYAQHVLWIFCGSRGKKLITGLLVSMFSNLLMRLLKRQINIIRQRWLWFF